MNRLACDSIESIVHDSGSERYQWKAVIPFLSIHLMCLWVFQTGISLEWVALGIASYYLRMFAITAGYHRYFSHRSFKTSRVSQFLLAFFAMTAAQKGVLWWAAHHRHHHKHSDQEKDRHSPLQRGFWFSHVGWILSEDSDRTEFALVRDLAKYPELRVLNRFHFIPPCCMHIDFHAVGFRDCLGIFISTTVLYHCTFFINSLTHIVGRVRYNSRDGSKNSFFWLCSVVGRLAQ
jgi:stearoyl-CoA desaturase (delta-9 desaturase)